jgi:hypothetical protein
MKKFFVAKLIFLTVYIVKAQSISIGGLFPTIDHSGTITQKLNYSFYYFAAFPLINFAKPNVSKDANFLLFYAEQALSFNVTKNFSFTGSYLYQRANVVYDNFINENRIYVQATFKHGIKSINIKHRLRFDNRFIQNRITGATPYTHRLRYLIGVDFQIKNNLYIAAYEEAFFNTFKDANVFYGENWAYAAIGVKLNERNKIETGPLYVTWNTAENTWFNQYYLQITWISHINFIKKK